MKKKTRLGVLGFSLLPAMLAYAPNASASNTLTVSTAPAAYQFNGQYGYLGSGYVSLNYQGHLYVPVRFIAENTGNQVTWNDQTQTVTFTQGTGNPASSDWNTSQQTGEESVRASALPIHFVFNGQEKTLDSGYVALIYNDHVYVPVHFVAENLGTNVQWMPKSETVDISWAQGENNATLKRFMQKHPQAYIGPVQEVSFGDKNYLAVSTENDEDYAAHPPFYLIDANDVEMPFQTAYDFPASANVVQQGTQNFLLVSGSVGAHTSTLDLYGVSGGTPAKLQSFTGSSGTSFWLQDGKLDILQSNRTYSWDLTKPDGTSDDSVVNDLYEYNPSTQKMEQVATYSEGMFSSADAVGNPRVRALSAFYQIQDLLVDSSSSYSDNWTDGAKSSFVAHKADLSFLLGRTDPVLSLTTLKQDDHSASYTYQANGHVLQINLELNQTWQITGITVDGK